MKKELIKSILLFIASFVFLVVGVIILPEITSIGEKILLIVLGSLILCYVFGYLLLKVATKVKGIMLVLTLVEMIILIFVALATIANTWIAIGNFQNGTVVIGGTLWIIGIVETFRAYYSIKDSENKYPVYKLVINLCLITIGAILFIGNISLNYQLLYLLCFALIVLSITTIILGVLKLKNK